MSGSTAMSAAGRSLPTTYPYGLISISKRDSQRAGSVPAPLYPVLEHLQGRRAISFGGAGHRTVVAFLDPALIRTGVFAGQRQPHQATRPLRRETVAIEQHLPKHGLRLVLTLLGGQPKPARAIGEIARSGVGGLQVEARQIVLRVGVAEIGRSVSEHLARPLWIGRDLRIRDTGQVIPSERDKGVGNDLRLRSGWAVLAMGVGDAAEIVEGEQVVLRHAVAFGVHPTELPLRNRVAVLGGILQRRKRGA